MKITESELKNITADHADLSILDHKKSADFSSVKSDPKFRTTASELLLQSRDVVGDNFLANLPEILANVDDILKNNFQIVDSREKDFYLGINKLKGFGKFGTIKSSINIPSKWFLEGRGLRFNNLNLLKKICDYSEIDLDKNLIFFCYSGLESSINWFVSYELMKNKNSKLYEGSLFDWVTQNKPLYKKL